jgi:polyferredoxin
MGIVISLILIAFGAILTWAVNASSSSIDVNVVGVVLMVVGIVVFLISVVLWRTWWGAGFWAGRYGEVTGRTGSARPTWRRNRLHLPSRRPARRLRRHRSETEGGHRG